MASTLKDGKIIETVRMSKCPACGFLEDAKLDITEESKEETEGRKWLEVSTCIPPFFAKQL